jgi:hypothetical protein
MCETDSTISCAVSPTTGAFRLPKETTSSCLLDFLALSGADFGAFSAFLSFSGCS